MLNIIMEQKNLRAMEVNPSHQEILDKIILTAIKAVNAKNLEVLQRVVELFNSELLLARATKEQATALRVAMNNCTGKEYSYSKNFKCILGDTPEGEIQYYFWYKLPEIVESF